MALSGKQSAEGGHASLAEGPDGRWFLAHLCGRPVGKARECILGRETSIQEVVWENDWPRLAGGSDEPQAVVGNSYQPVESNEALWAGNSWRDDFDCEKWSINFQSLQTPLGKRASLSERKGWLRLYGAESLKSRFDQTLLACRQQGFSVLAETKLDFYPETYQHTAGLVYYYDTSSFFLSLHDA